MKKLISLLLILIITSCSKLEFQHESNLDYSVYTKSFAEVKSEIYSLPIDNEDILKHFCNKLSFLSQFDSIFHAFEKPEMVDSILPAAYLVIKLNIKEFDYKIKREEDAEGNFSGYYYYAYYTISCKTYNFEGLLFEIEKEGVASEENEGGYHTKVKEEALVDAIDKIAFYFTKSFEI